jgi:hypothetical protein
MQRHLRVLTIDKAMLRNNNTRLQQQGQTEVLDEIKDLDTLVRSIMAHYAASVSDVYDHAKGLTFERDYAVRTNEVTDTFFNSSKDDVRAGLTYVHQMLEPQPSDPHYEVPYDKRMSVLVGCVAGLGVARSGLGVFNDMTAKGTQYRSVFYALESCLTICDRTAPPFFKNAAAIPDSDQLTQALKPYVVSCSEIPPVESVRAFAKIFPELCLPTSLGEEFIHVLLWSVLWGVQRAEHLKNPDWPVIQQSLMLLQQNTTPH